LYAGLLSNDNLRQYLSLCLAVDLSGDDMNVASRVPNPPAALAERPGTIGQAAVPRFGLGLRRATLRRNPGRQSADRLVRGDQRKLHCCRAAQPLRMLDRNLRTLSGGDARCVPVDRIDRSANFEYLQGLRELAGRVEPKWISDHLC